MGADASSARAAAGVALAAAALAACDPPLPAARVECGDCGVPGALGARLRIIHFHHVSSAFELVTISYAIDGAPASTWRRIGLGEPPAADIGAPPGAHRVDVRMDYRGRFDSSVAGYRFELATHHDVALERGRVTQVVIEEYQRPDRPLAEQLAARWLGP